MKKQSTKAKTTKSPAKTAVKSRAKTTSVEVASKAAAKTTKPRKTTVAAKKQAAPKRKGLLHHTKRIYHLTPKFVHGMLIGAVIGLGIVSFAGSTKDVNANPDANACIKTRTPINVNLQNANVEVNTSDCATDHTFLMKAWYAPAANGIPHNQQRIFANSETKVISKNNPDWTRIGVKMLPEGCFYQIDLVDVTNPAGKEGYPIVRAALGGTRDCTPTPVYTCDAMNVLKGADRKVTVNNFKVTAVNATLDHVVVYWNFPNAADTNTYKGSALGATHQYAKDGTYKINAVAYFKMTGRFGDEEIAVAKQVCTAKVAFISVTPGNQEVCELKTGKVVQIPEGAYDMNLYGPTNSKECNPTVIETESSSTLAKTGPGALITVLICAAVGGYVFHHGHRHIKHKKQHRHAR